MDTKIYFDLSDEISEILNANGISIEDILENEGFEARVAYEVQPAYDGEPARTKNLVEVATLVVASSGLIVSMAYAISKTLNTLYSKPYLVSFYEHEELRDASGNIVFDKDGSPIFKVNKKYRFMEPKDAKGDESIEFSSGFKDGIVIKFNSKQGI